MPEGSDTSPLELLAALLKQHGVRFVVIGGQAETLHGSARMTYDIDLCYERTTENLERLAAALTELDVRLRNAPPDLPFKIDAQALALGDNFTFDTSLDAVDLLGWVEPVGDYHDLSKNAETYTLGDMELDVISLDDLIRIKRHLNRPKDRESLLHLIAIKEIREQSGDDST